MLQLNQLLPQDQLEPYWVLTSEYNEELPQNIHYAVFDFYCEKITCDCQQLTADIMALDENNGIITNKLATINYDWSTQETQCHPTLAENSPQTPLASSLLRAYKNLVHDDEYQAHIRIQHARIKLLAFEKKIKTKKPEIRSPDQQMGRNEPCPCGSNKKYKKCCLNNKIVSS